MSAPYYSGTQRKPRLPNQSRYTLRMDKVEHLFVWPAPVVQGVNTLDELHDSINIDNQLVLEYYSAARQFMRVRAQLHSLLGLPT